MYTPNLEADYRQYILDLARAYPWETPMSFEAWLEARRQAEADQPTLELVTPAFLRQQAD